MACAGGEGRAVEREVWSLEAAAGGGGRGGKRGPVPNDLSRA